MNREKLAKTIEATNALGCGHCAGDFTAEQDQTADAIDVSVHAVVLADELMPALANVWDEGRLAKAAEWMRAVEANLNGGRGPIQKAINPYREATR